MSPCPLGDVYSTQPMFKGSNKLCRLGASKGGIKEMRGASKRGIKGKWIKRSKGKRVKNFYDLFIIVHE